MKAGTSVLDVSDTHMPGRDLGGLESNLLLEMRLTSAFEGTRVE